MPLISLKISINYLKMPLISLKFPIKSPLIPFSKVVNPNFSNFVTFALFAAFVGFNVNSKHFSRYTVWSLSAIYLSVC